MAPQGLRERRTGLSACQGATNENRTAKNEAVEGFVYFARIAQSSFVIADVRIPQAYAVVARARRGRAKSGKRIRLSAMAAMHRKLYAETYWERFQSMSINSGEFSWDELALRFAVHCPGVSTAIVGTANIDNLERNITLANQGPLPNELVTQIREAFRHHDQDWRGQI